jgi:hypothetical protein
MLAYNAQTGAPEDSVRIGTTISFGAGGGTLGAGDGLLIVPIGTNLVALSGN